MVRIYTSFKDIDQDLKTLNLQRQIALEELKYTKHDLQESVMPPQWVNTVLGFVKKYGILYIIKRIFK
ncbi:DUF6327 family protein [Aquimarina sp. ERC-38]|uniref:DUF6327 family protein n=1 Tax=Aquimarina sp. ERC-38 TaxID=2949996 RepID=UPI002245AAA3|nr:DUF6327 family protein [Aquimarina sp. ERC-38]UZO81114.1 DUF6327 family protein [Aquimarina sp. ERC-38]